MAQKENINFSAQLPSGADPVSAQGALLAQSGAIEGQAASVGAAGTSTLIKQGVSTAIDAAHGYLESSQESDIKKILEQRQGSQVAGDAALIFANPDSTPEDLRRANRDLDSVKNALSQGVITREQALLAIDAKVKSYSNILPGYASELRKKAVALTGVEHMGRYAEYVALTKQSMSEKMAEQQLKDKLAIEQHIRLKFADVTGRPLQGGIDGDDGRWFQQRMAIIEQEKAADIQAKLKKNTVAQNEAQVHQVLNANLAIGLLDLSEVMQGIVVADPKTGQPKFAPTDRSVLREKALALVQTKFGTLRAKILSYDENSLSPQTRETMLNRLNTQEAELTKNLTNQDTFDAFDKMMNRKQAMTRDIWSSFALANPEASIARESGLLSNPIIYQLYSQARERGGKELARFENLYPLTAKALNQLSGNLQFADDLRNNAKDVVKDPEHLDKIKDVDPVKYDFLMRKLSDTLSTIAIKGYGVDPETQTTRKLNIVNMVTAFARQIDVNKPDMVREWNRVISHPGVVDAIKVLPKQEQLNVISPIALKTRELLDKPVVGLFAQLGNIQRKEADGTFSSVSFDVTLNPTTKLFEVVDTTKKRRGVGTSGGMLSGNLAGVSPPPLVYGGVKTIIDNINKSIIIFNNLKELGWSSSEFAEGDLSTMLLNRYNAGFFDLSYEERSAALAKAGKSPDEKPLKLKKPIPTSELIK